MKVIFANYNNKDKMPILYVCMINPLKTVIVEALGSKTTGDFRQKVVDYHDKFERFGKKFIALSAELHLSYRDQSQYTFACISTAYDIKELEAQKFLEKVDEVVVELL